MKLLAILFVSVLTFSFAQAADIGAAGCGLGNMVLGSDPGFIQVPVATTNGSSYNQTFGITTGTSNCGSGAMNAQLNNFVESNKIALAKEAARGEGETLAGLSQIVGCKSEFGTKIKSHYQQIFSNDNTQEISSKILTVAQNNPGFCS